ncbi:junctional adhesion molecule-like [Eurytemora carolleeae]|uniref:junctional adhesion molecule-like n=1 Tax=Eurytemora carolleeae TaxID=1294199 RepID=UPI000C780998|nr:junctional adhesion molecule-like [Eurytemora carolleeae]|eukprot:XP_023323778.1 junctional adhesion molecule-like [Eurytemora affinis]
MKKIIFFIILGSLGFLGTVGKEKYDVIDSSVTQSTKSPVSSRAERSLGKVSPKGLYTGPYFAPSLISNYSSMVGDTVHLSCVVFQVETQSVSWVRSRDSHILSVDTTVFVSDPRVVIIQNKIRGEWTLIVKGVKKSDEGVYECQISTQNKMSHLTYLKVLEPKVEIEGGPDIFTKRESTVQLKCLVTGSSHVNSIKWLYEDEVLQTHGNTEIRLSRSPESTVSELIIRQIHSNRMGNYSCIPEGLKPVLVYLHVLDGNYSLHIYHHVLDGIYSLHIYHHALDGIYSLHIYHHVLDGNYSLHIYHQVLDDNYSLYIFIFPS